MSLGTLARVAEQHEYSKLLKIYYFCFDTLKYVTLIFLLKRYKYDANIRLSQIYHYVSTQMSKAVIMGIIKLSETR